MRTVISYLIKLKPYLFVILVTFIQCKQKSPLMLAIEEAGENNIEIRKVLDYYSSPKDSLKKKAAEFLIVNMIGKEVHKYSENSGLKVLKKKLAEIDLDSSPNNIIVRKDICQNLLGTYESKTYSYEYQTQPELKSVNADCIIDNIDFAFKAWELPWSRNYSFYQFCNYILPLRYSSENPTKWRSMFYNDLIPFIEFLDSISDPIEAAKKIMTLPIKRYVWVPDLQGLFPNPGTLDLVSLYDMKCTQHCLEYSGLFAVTLRTLGVASTLIKEQYIDNTHIESAILTPDGKLVHVMGLDKYPNKTPRGTVSYTEMSEFDILNNRDISSELMDITSLRIKIWENDINGSFKLCRFNHEWIPVHDGNKNGEYIDFKNINADGLYLPILATDDLIIPISDPVIFKAGIIDSSWSKKRDSLINIKVYRKHPIKSRLAKLENDLFGAKIQIASSPEFKDAKTIYKVNSVESQYPNEIIIKPTKTRYIRFLLPRLKNEEMYFSALSELSFGYKHQGILNEFEGNALFSNGISLPNANLYFDNDILSFLNIVFHHKPINYPLSSSTAINLAPLDSVWIGLDLKEEKLINYLMFCPRNDKNAVYPGMKYKLSYWNNKWIEIETKVANNNFIEFKNVPFGRVLWLKNVDEGNEERLFLINDKGEQIWPGYI